jgi:hypothetical protein
MFTIEYYFEYYSITVLDDVTVLFGTLPIMLNPIIASIIGFALFKTCFFEKKLITIQKIIIVQYCTVF